MSPYLARIAELEAKLRQSGQDLATVVNDKTRLEAGATKYERLLREQAAEISRPYLTRIAELVAENEQLKARVVELEKKWAHAVDAYRAADERKTELEAEVERVAADDLRKLNLVVNQREAGRSRIAELEAALGEATGRIETDGRLIAELEADAEKVAADELRKLNLVIDQREAQRIRIAELEAERGRLRFALECIGAGETAEPCRMARAALSPTPSEETRRP